MDALVKGPGDLKKEVLDRDLCSDCGLCVGMCPYIKNVREKPVIIHSCGLKEGNCYRICPRTGMDTPEMDRIVFGREREDHALGCSSGLYFARACRQDTARSGQYGGVVTALTALALDLGMVEAAVLAGGPPLSPRPVLARTGEEVLSCAGSKYTAVPTLTALNRAAGEGLQSVGVVGRPCQVAAVRKGQLLQREEAEDNISASRAGLVIGLFCFWSLNPGFYGYLGEKSGGEEIIRVDIPVEGLMVTTGKGTVSRPVEEIREYIKESCRNCIDCTSEWADLSVGSTEYDPAWNTLVVRTEKGESLVNRASREGVIEIKPYPQERLPILRKAALNKKMRVLGGAGRPDYIQLSEEYMAAIKKQWEVLQP